MDKRRYGLSRVQVTYHAYAFFGQYWLSGSRLKDTKQDALSITEYPFYYELELQQDGFSHVMNQLIATVRLLAKPINQNVKALSDE